MSITDPIADALTVTGNLIVSGTTTTVNSETISLADNIIALNSNFTSGTPSEDAGISITRGSSAAKRLFGTNQKMNGQLVQKGLLQEHLKEK